MIDLVHLKQIVWDDDTLGATFTSEDIAAERLESAHNHREKLIETLAEVDDQIMEAYLAETHR